MEKKYIFNSSSPEDTEIIAKKIATFLKEGSIICLDGDLGTGKTIFAKGLIKALGVNDIVTSPTFTIVNEYIGIYKIYHFDVYRIEDPCELYDIGFDEYIFGNGVSIIEWGNKIRDILPNEYLDIIIEKDLKIGQDYRSITFIPHGDKYINIRSWCSENFSS